jgi:hypothetical protein
LLPGHRKIGTVPDHFVRRSKLFLPEAKWEGGI